MGVQPETAQRVGGLQAKQPAADDDSCRCVSGVQGAHRVGADGVEVVEGPVHMAGRQVAAGNRGYERV